MSEQGLQDAVKRIDNKGHTLGSKSKGTERKENRPDALGKRDNGEISRTSRLYYEYAICNLLN